MKSIYHYEEIKPDTRVFGVIGDPVGHSLSPLIHNGAFKHLGINAVYVPFRVPRGELTPFLQSFQALPIDGLSVTIPHKELAAKVATAKDPSVEKSGAANTLVFQNGVCKAANTDLRAAIDSLKAAIAENRRHGRIPARKADSSLTRRGRRGAVDRIWIAQAGLSAHHRQSHRGPGP